MDRLYPPTWGAVGRLVHRIRPVYFLSELTKGLFEFQSSLVNGCLGFTLYPKLWSTPVKRTFPLIGRAEQTVHPGFLAQATKLECTRQSYVRIYQRACPLPLILFKSMFRKLLASRQLARAHQVLGDSVETIR